VSFYGEASRKIERILSSLILAQMAAYNQFVTKCNRFVASFVEEDFPSPAYVRFATLVTHCFLNRPELPYAHPLHPFQRYGAEELDTDDAIAQLAEDLEMSLVQEGLGDKRLTFFGKHGLNRPNVEWLLEWFLKYADATTGLGDFDEAEWEEEEEDEEGEEDAPPQETQDGLVQSAFLQLMNSQPQVPSWSPNLVYNSTLLD
jgi:hypothetical protein